MRLLSVFVCVAALGIAQHHDMPPAEKPVTLMPGLGIWKHPIRTASLEAQRYFDQGLALLYGFNRYEALRSFRKVVELDPKAAMGYWGIAMSQGPYVNMDGEPTYDIKASCAAVEAGIKAASADREKAYLEAAEKRCPDYSRPEAYSSAMRELAGRYPEDLDAATLLAESLMVPVRWKWYAADGTPAAGMEEAERTLERVLRRWPDHPGANHYYIHAVESSRTPERAVPSAQRLMGITPAMGHMVHMPAHIWLVLGEWELAASLNERAAEVDRRYFAATSVSSGSYPMYYVHNLHFVTYARWMQGRKEDGLKAADTMAGALEPMAKEMPEMADAFRALTMFGRVRFGDWDGILTLPEPKREQASSTLVWHFSRAAAMAAKGDRAGAQKEQAAFETGRKMVPAEAPWGNNKAVDVLALASEVLAGRLAATPAESVTHFRKAVELQDALVYDEPPAWYYPVRESLGAALLRAGNPAEAAQVFREGVTRSPRNGRMLFGLTEALKAQGKTEDAGWVKREFDAAWAKADVKLTLADL
jgi:tetratricopeptide (TPR) repeat protein